LSPDYPNAASLAVPAQYHAEPDTPLSV
jgi:hypothetical protein